MVLQESIRITEIIQIFTGILEEYGDLPVFVDDSDAEVGICKESFHIREGYEKSASIFEHDQRRRYYYPKRVSIL